MSRIHVRGVIILGVGLMLAIGEHAFAQSGRYDLLVSSRTNHSVKRYDGETGEYLNDFITSGSGGLSLTQEVAFGPDGDLYVSGRGNTAILKYNPVTGAFIGSFTTGYTLNEPTKMSFAEDGMLYVSQWGAGQTTVARFDANTGAFVDEITPNLQLPMQIAFDDAGTLHVVSFGSADVRRFDDTGAALGTFTTGGNLQGPVNLWFDDSGDLLVIDWQVGAVKRFDGTTGAYESDFITGMTNAEGWTFGPDGRLYIADWGSHRVNAYNPNTGQLDAPFAQGGGLQNPNSVLFFERTPDFTVSLSAANASVSAGQSTTLTVMLDPDRDLAFPEPVDLMCGASSAVQCAFSPSSVTPGQAGASSTLTVTSTAAAGASGTGPFPWSALAFVSVVTAVVLLATRRPATVARHPRLLVALRVSVVLLFAGALACGDSSTEPNPMSQTITVQVNGTSGELTRGASFQLTINQ